jgi:hypothetical protein
MHLIPQWNDGALAENKSLKPNGTFKTNRRQSERG